jgi:hypothetical protein
MSPPLPYFKVNIYLFPLPHFASIFFAYLWSFRWPNYIVTLPRYFSFRLPYLNIPTGPHSDELDKNIQRKSLRLLFSHWSKANIQIVHYFGHGYLEEEKSMTHSFTDTFGAKYLTGMVTCVQMASSRKTPTLCERATRQLWGTNLIHSLARDTPLTRNRQLTADSDSNSLLGVLLMLCHKAN